MSKISEIMQKQAEKVFSMRPQERQRFFYGEFAAKQNKKPNWIGVDYSEDKDQTITFKSTGFQIEVI